MKLKVFMLSLLIIVLGGRGGEASSGARNLTLRSSIETGDEVIRLAHLVLEPLGEDENIIILESPPWGSQKILTANFIRQRIKRLGVQLGGARRVVVTRKVWERSEEVRSLLVEQLKRKLEETPWCRSAHSFRLELINFPSSLKLPPGEITLECFFPRKISGYRVVSFVIQGADAYKRRFSTGCRFHLLTECAVARRDIDRNKRITDEDIEWVKTDIAECYETPVTEREDIIGMRSEKYIKSGNVIALKALERVPDIKKGDPVSLEVAKGCLLVSARGTALEDGWKGDRILVRNQASGKIEKHVVLEKGKVSPAAREETK
ncbi:MAG: flagellar basal body P-ring formation protein FlgA [Candidatus Krumholzibacteriota bacterium]|nr:flagellar basal body P-ring formation protein FlgA [Candidatus Krumholzibacteriota bacterium]